MKLSDRFFDPKDRQVVRTVAEWQAHYRGVTPGMTADEAARYTKTLVRLGRLLPVGEPA